MAERRGELEVRMMASYNTVSSEKKSVITNNIWEYVRLWMERNLKNSSFKEKAVQCWSHAGDMYGEAHNVNFTIRPIILYYSYMNSVKALLYSKNIKPNEYHGISGKNSDFKADLSKEKIKVRKNGIIIDYSRYIGLRLRDGSEYRLKNIMKNIVYIHRAYSQTYLTDLKKDLFIPVRNIIIKENNGAYKVFSKISKKYKNKREIRGINRNYFTLYSNSDGFYIESIKSLSKNSNSSCQKQMMFFYRKYRRFFRFIIGDDEYWYIKKSYKGNADYYFLDDIILAYMAMHRLSEISRYDPALLNRMNNSIVKWLIIEFLEHSPRHFLYQVATEIVGCRFRWPLIRTY